MNLNRGRKSASVQTSHDQSSPQQIRKLIKNQISRKFEIFVVNLGVLVPRYVNFIEIKTAIVNIDYNSES